MKAKNVVIGMIIVYLLDPNDTSMNNGQTKYFTEGNKRIVDCILQISKLYFVAGDTVVISSSHNKTLERWHSTVEENTKHLRKKNIGLSQYQVDIDNLLLNRLHLTGRWPIVVSCSVRNIKKRDPLEWDRTNEDTFQSYIVLPMNLFFEGHIILKELKDQIQYLETFSAWNSHGRFIVPLLGSPEFQDINTLMEAILNQFAKWKIFNVIFLVQRDSNSSSDVFNIYSWFPYQQPSGSCGVLQNVVLSDTWMHSDSGGYFLHNKSLFSERNTQNMYGCPLRAYTGHHPPFAILKTDISSKTTSISGLDVEIVHQIAKYMNATLFLKPVFHTSPWGQLVNNTWTGLRGKIVYDMADIVMVGWIHNLNDSLMFQTTERYFTDRMTWYVPRAKNSLRWMSIARVFTTIAWFSLFLSILLSSFLLWILAVPQSISKIDKLFRTFSLCVSYIWCVILNLPVPKMPQTLSLRIFFISWIAFCLALNNIFQVFFVTFLIDPGLEHQVENFKELVDSDLLVPVSYFFIRFFDKTMFRDQSRIRVMDGPYPCLQLALSEENVATILSRTQVSSKVAEFIHQNKVFPLSPFHEDVHNNHLVMVLQKGNPFFRHINNIIIHLVEAGLPVKFLKDILDINLNQHRVKISIDLGTEYQPMSLTNFQSVFVLLLIGSVLSIISLFLEIILQKVQEHIS